MDASISKDSQDAFFENMGKELERMFLNAKPKIMKQLMEEIKRTPDDVSAKDAPKIKFNIKGEVKFWKEIAGIATLKSNRKDEACETSKLITSDSTPDLLEYGKKTMPGTDGAIISHARAK